MKTIIDKIKAVDWHQYDGYEWYDADKVAPVLIKLATAKQPNKTPEYADSITNDVLFTIGNNHAGVYYPAVLSALDILIELANQNENTCAKKYAELILNELHYFGPNVESYEGCTYEALEVFVKSKTEPYSDEALGLN